ncbi:MAG TPA: helix-turn-helix domain-containing protein [Thermoplasmata archaeon]|nr:helix-turn-helix domain-containing protein [Thermoplasmata archaeon]
MGRPGGTLAELLVEHGVPERGARLYLAACREGPQTAAELARLASLHRVEAYRFIRALEREGLLRATAGRPARFVALPLEQLVDRWIRRTTEHLDRLRGDRDRIVADWRAGEPAAAAPDVRKFAVVEGPGPIQRHLARRLDGAERELLFTVPPETLAAAIDGGVDRSIRAARARGVRARLVTEVTGSNLAAARLFAGLLELRHATAPVTQHAVLVDRSAALLYLSEADGPGSPGAPVALWSTAPSLVAVAREQHHRLWAKGLPFPRRLLELDNPPSARLPVRRGRAGASFDRLREVTELGLRVTGLPSVGFDLPDLIRTIGAQIGRDLAADLEGTDPDTVVRSLTDHYARDSPGRLEKVADRPLTLKVTGCFACTPQGTEIGRVLCPKILETVFERRLGGRWSVSAPDPRRHAARGCVFVATPG